MFSISPPDIFNNIVAYCLIAFFEAVVLVVLTRWFRRFHDLTPPMLAFIGIAAFGLMTLGINQLVNLYEWWIRPAAIQTITSATPNEELASKIRKWLDDFHLQVQVNNREEAYFSFIARGPSTIPIEVMRLKKEHEQFITALGLVVIGDDDRTKMNSLPEQQRLRILMEIKMEMLRQKVVSSGNLLRGLQIENRVPVSDLSQAKLMDQIDDIENAMALVILRVRTLLDEQK